jgi:hypothetical protein
MMDNIKPISRLATFLAIFLPDFKLENAVSENSDRLVLWPGAGCLFKAENLARRKNFRWPGSRFPRGCPCPAWY